MEHCMETGTSSKRLLPANAYRKLEPSEVYTPVVPPDSNMKEVTLWSVTFGLLMVAVFAAACVYIALRAGSGIEAAIPIAVAAIFFGKLRSTKSTILENVIVQSIGQASGVVAAGAAFVIPGLYLNQIENVSIWHLFLACFLGGSLGVVLIIPLRRFFVRDRHGELPFPEATATTEILVSGEQAGKGAGKVLILAFCLGGFFDFFVEIVHLWNAEVSTTTLLGSLGQDLARMGFELKMTAIAALFGLGYIIGLKYCAIIFMGSVLANLVMIPLVKAVGGSAVQFTSKTFDVTAMLPSQIFSTFIKPIGIGAIAMAGVIGLIRMGKIIIGSLALGFKGLGKAGKGEARETLRTDADLNPKTVLLIELVSTILLGCLFFVVCMFSGAYSFAQSLGYALIGTVIAFFLCFLFTPVAAEAIAIVGVNPVSGMTLVTVVISSIVMATVGLSGKPGIFVTLIIGTAVCTALSTSGALISDFKIGYWIGATPRNQQIWKFLGLAVASLVVAVVIPLMDQGYHFLVEKGGQLVSNEDVLPAPQANMISAVVKGLMGGEEQPYLLYGVGGILSIVVTILGLPTLAFALGLYLSISLTSAQLVGGLVAWLVGRSGRDERVREARKNQGTLIASGMIAGAAIFGILSALMRLKETGYAVKYLSVGVQFHEEPGITGEIVLRPEGLPWFEGLSGQLAGIVMFVLLGVLTYLIAKWGAEKEIQG
jgi:putative OPT family oligopeptide transporter